MTRTHGQTSGGYTPEYRAWLHIRNRCFNPNVEKFKNHGGRGITVCPKWRDSFEAFFQDVGKRPSPRHTIDRIDNDGNYEPGNCRWATQTEQQNNKRNNIKIVVSNRELTLKEACKDVGVDYRFVWLRLKRGYSLQDAFSKPRKANAGTGSHLLPLSSKYTNSELFHMFAASQTQAIRMMKARAAA